MSNVFASALNAASKYIRGSPQQGEENDSRAKSGLVREAEEFIRWMLAANAHNDLEVVRRAKAEGRYLEPLSCLPARKLFSMTHFALFRPLFHDFLELRLSLLQLQGQQRSIAREMGAIERLKKRRAAKLQERLLTK